MGKYNLGNVTNIQNKKLLYEKLVFFCLLVFYFILECSVPASAQVYRNEDQDLFSQKYQARIIQSAHVSDEQREALTLWQSEINHILTTPKKSRPTEKDLHEQFFTDVFVKATWL